MNCISKLLIILPLLALLSLQSCKGLKKKQGIQAEKAWKTTISNASKERVEYKTLELSGKAQLDIEKMGVNNMGVSYRVSMEKDKRIWIRVSKLIEVARILARPDSLFVLDKINRRYIACDYALAEKFTGLEMDFELLQDLILGNFNPIPEELSPGLQENGVQTFTGEKAGTDFTYKIDNSTFKVKEIKAVNSGLKQNTVISYSDFSEKASTLMPQNTSISVLSPEEISIDLSHRKVDLNPSDPSFSFRVPSSYAKRGCK
ncbi:MAG: DUF4292 domain-containing protein [Bacteroidia bacterium]|nr:DUF4292 domain-containing protein [Bacteroidia bacterium]